MLKTCTKKDWKIVCGFCLNGFLRYESILFNKAFFPEYPQEEYDAVEYVFKSIEVKEFKPIGVVFDVGNYECDPEYVE